MPKKRTKPRRNSLVSPEVISRDPWNDVFREFEEKVLQLDLQWQMLKDLYGDSNNLTLFESAGVNFWSTLQIYLTDHFLLAVSRFFDPAVDRYSKECNLTLAYLLLRDETKSIRAELSTHRKKLEDLWEVDMKLWRNKRIAHSPLDYALGEKKLPDIPFEKMSALVEGISEFCRMISVSDGRPEMEYALRTTRWVPSLLERLRLGIKDLENPGDPLDDYID